jgi:hypothetical protein
MIRSIARAVALSLLAASTAAAGEIVLPAFAYQSGGKGGNRWTTEIYVTNTGPTTGHVRLDAAIVSYSEVVHPCMPPVVLEREVPPYSTVAWPASDVVVGLGCPDRVLGALVFGADVDLVINSHMVNDRGVTDVTGGSLLRGFGQDIPGIAMEDLPSAKGTYIVPGLIWHPNPCGPPRFEVYVQFVNPGEDPVTVTLNLHRDATPDRMMVAGRDVQTPVAVTVDAKSWKQLLIAPSPLVAPSTDCMEPQLFDLFFQTDAPVAMYASVVDRLFQDPRTVLPVLTAAAQQ